MRDSLGAGAAVEVLRAVPFASPPERTLHLDLYRPVPPRGDAADARRAVVVLVYGGEWRDGDRDDLSRFGLALAERGFACAAVEYRGSDEAAFPAQIRDVKAAIRWLRANADRAGLDPNRVGAFGHAAGAHLAVLAALTPGRPELAPDPDHLVGEASFDGEGPADALAATVGVAGLYNFEHTPERESIRSLLGGSRSEVPEAYELASPSTHLRNAGSDDASPILLLHGAEDDVTPSMASELFYDGLEASAGTAECVVAEGAGHDVHLEQFDWTLAWTEAFLDRHLR
ncbi:alpha/beta hydrolase [Halopelagius longus]|uniref:Acetyl esterase/lipase n=1 Tax=Halopelagius longus TaxID=1236180 RepID=A0A1H1DE82_9EURY|nr:alpha/beta hydrolase [Halopelagius longus]RDI71287.1 alpha/beta hydrolase [Halopelagius longus]SDQ74538.1 Acetyl esterase/lipase [Halopelagius longus]